MHQDRGNRMKRRWICVLAALILLAGMAVALRCCYIARYPRQFTYASPEGTNTIVVRYDARNCPAVLKKGVLRNKKVWQYEKPGLPESAVFEVEWMSENRIRLMYDDAAGKCKEDYVIMIPE